MLKVPLPPIFYFTQLKIQIDIMDLSIGVTGYSTQDFDNSKADQLIRDAFRRLLDHHEPNTVQVISGYTAHGIPLLAYQIADEFDWATKGIACKKAHKFDTYDVDETEIIGTQWGDESETFLNQIDVLIRIGGGKQAKEETQKAKDQGIPVIEYDL